MSRGSLFCSLAVLGVLAITSIGCGPGGPATVPVKGKLTIDGQPADKVSITLIPTEKGGQEASGQVNNGAFTLYTGVEGKPGAMVGKYKVVLAVMGGADMAMYKRDGGGDKSAAPEVKTPFAEKYRDAGTSDKEVEITAGGSDLTIDVSSS